MLPSDPTDRYDYIFTGAGCAGLSLLMHLISTNSFADKKILLVDKSHKTENDRTWCFWETEPGLFQSIVCKQWQNVWFHSNEFSRLLEIDPYQYKMIRGIDFYDHCFSVIEQQKNIEVVYAEVSEVNVEDTSVVAQGHRYFGKYIFNSILFEKPVLKSNEFYLLQHFKGWLIETTQPVFNPSQAVLMDFRVSQQHGTTFAYVLPVSANLAMVEYTLFTKELLQPEEYDAGLREYISRFIPVDYEIKQEEKGVIPMTNFSFSAGQGNVVNIGSAGGQTKPSSGYTFYFIQQHSKAITDALLNTGQPFVSPLRSKKFNYYDSVLLNVLSTGKMPGAKVFEEMFRKNEAETILRFLNNDSSLKEDLKVISSFPIWPFLRAGLQEIRK
jgi:lycopene beta-cyclase